MPSRPRKAHVIEKRWQEGGFHVVRYVECRCGQRISHYNAGHLAELFKAHQAQAELGGDDTDGE